MLSGIIMRSRLNLLLVLLMLPAFFTLTGCEQLGLDDSAKLAAAKDAEGRAIGSACRHSGRALEECYMLNPKALKAAVFNGWRDMDGYMRDNKIESVIPADYGAKHAETKPGDAKAPDAKGEAKSAEGKPGSEAAKETKESAKPAKR